MIICSAIGNILSGNANHRTANSAIDGQGALPAIWRSLGIAAFLTAPTRTRRLHPDDNLCRGESGPPEASATLSSQKPRAAMGSVFAGNSHTNRATPRFYASTKYDSQTLLKRCSGFSLLREKGPLIKEHSESPNRLVHQHLTTVRIQFIVNEFWTLSTL